MTVCGLAALLLLLTPSIRDCSGVLAGTNITLLTFPVNVTSWRSRLTETINRTFTHQLEELKSTLRGYQDFLKNGSINCTGKGGQCFPDVPSCCDVKDEDLQCLPDGETWVCGEASNETMTGQRLDALEQGFGLGMAESHPWVYSWEFQSKSAMEHEELQAAEEAEWKKNWIKSSKENFWVKSFKKVKTGGKNVWHDLRKIKRLKELKDSLVSKYKIRKEKAQDTKERKDTIVDRTVVYPDEIPEKEGGTPEEEGSEESIIKFDDEIPKQKKVEFRIDDIIKDAVNLVDNKLKGKKHQKKQDKNREPSLTSLLPPDEKFNLEQIDDTEKNLMEKINELKKLKERQDRARSEVQQRPESKVDVLEQSNIDKLIEKQVKLILEEERNLDKLKKIEELKRLEEGMKQQGQRNPG